MDIPPSDNIVRVKLLDTTTYLTGKTVAFVNPVVPGHETINFKDLAFLLENERSGKRVMFDLGMRKDYWNLPPSVQRLFGLDIIITGVKIDKNVSEILEEGGVELETIDSCIWSHYHFDHCGNMSAFPPTTSITVGNGFKAAGLLPGYPENPESHVLASDLENRSLTEVKFDSGLKIGGFSAYDYFGDGSLYLLDTPGHCEGHLSALARTTPSSAEGGATFIFLGGDICHFTGDFRPTPEIPLPDPIPDSIIKWRNAAGNCLACPYSLTAHHPSATSEEAARTTPWYKLAPQTPTLYLDVENARASVLKMQALDQEPNILICIAHDAVLLDYLPVFNKHPEQNINDWKKNGMKEETHWGWMREIPVDGKPAHPPLIEGFWRDGRPWDYEAYKKTQDTIS